ncbi:unnamed protein product [Phaeothamnion confervicola]
MVTIFKNMTFHYIMNGRALASQRIGQERIVKRLFESLCLIGSAKWKEGIAQPNSTFEDVLRIIPRFYADIVRKERYDDATIIRTVADVIAGMTEQQAISLYSRFTGERLGSAVDPILF